MKLQLNEETLNAYIGEAIRQELNEGLLKGLFKAGKGLAKGVLGKTTAKQHKVSRKALKAAKDAAEYGKNYPDNVVKGVNADDFSRLKGTDVDKATAQVRLNATKDKADEVQKMLKQVADQNAEAAANGGFVDNDRLKALQQQLQYLNGQSQELQRQITVNNIKTWGARGAAGAAAAHGAAKAVKNGVENGAQRREKRKSMPTIGDSAQ